MYVLDARGLLHSYDEMTMAARDDLQEELFVAVDGRFSLFFDRRNMCTHAFWRVGRHGICNSVSALSDTSTVQYSSYNSRGEYSA